MEQGEGGWGQGKRKGVKGRDGREDQGREEEVGVGLEGDLKWERGPRTERREGGGGRGEGVCQNGEPFP